MDETFRIFYIYLILMLLQCFEHFILLEFTGLEKLNSFDSETYITTYMLYYKYKVFYVLDNNMNCFLYVCHFTVYSPHLIYD